MHVHQTIDFIYVCITLGQELILALSWDGGISLVSLPGAPHFMYLHVNIVQPALPCCVIVL